MITEQQQQVLDSMRSVFEAKVRLTKLAMELENATPRAWFKRLWRRLKEDLSQTPVIVAREDALKEDSGRQENHHANPLEKPPFR